MSCGMHTCNECRIHATYQNPSEPDGIPDDNDQIQWGYGGYTFMHPEPHVIFIPKSSPIWGSHNTPLNSLPSRHDDGRIHLPLSSQSIAYPERVKHILDMNLGEGSIFLTCKCWPPISPWPFLAKFQHIAFARTTYQCPQCFKKEDHPHLCDCTLRERFLDRWLCVPGYLKERQADDASLKQFYPQDMIYSQAMSRSAPGTCGCGARLNALPTRSIMVVCRW
ncbi:hypothetical protein BCR34DRAFT_240566 [Clohesyomyces aquaticus]|uniref:Uncharacterized protein n=1 Tax=Clohesyomyces aquaticus TaxID=1231657 RepID=A0A1Y1ZV45_9PLEO|nr:hypothetical protein BCR34DRAFT_240566 [Clohesyomyces aquaticus]